MTREEKALYEAYLLIRRWHDIIFLEKNPDIQAMEQDWEKYKTSKEMNFITEVVNSLNDLTEVISKTSESIRINIPQAIPGRMYLFSDDNIRWSTPKFYVGKNPNLDSEFEYVAMISLNRTQAFRFFKTVDSQLRGRIFNLLETKTSISETVIGDIVELVMKEIKQ